MQQAVDVVTTPEIDVVLGPTEDGGYYLIGLRAVHRELFEAMAWSTSEVLQETVRRADAKRLRVACLPIDTPEDLVRLQVALAAPLRQGRSHAPDGDLYRKDLSEELKPTGRYGVAARPDRLRQFRLTVSAIPN